MKKVYLLLVLSLIVSIFNSSAQVTRWYNYQDYNANQSISVGEDVGYSTLILWNDTTAVYGLNPGTPAYYRANILSAGVSFCPRMPAWDDASLYGSSIKVSGGDAYTIDSVRLYGVYLRNNLKTTVKDTIKLSLIYGDGTSASNIVTEGLSGGHYGTISFLDLTYDSLKNIAGKSLSGPAPYTQNIVLSNTDTASLFIRSFKLTTPFTVPAGYVAGMSLTFKSGDPSFVANDTIFDASGTMKYGEFAPYIQYITTFSGGPVDFALYNSLDSNMGYFRDATSSVRGWAGQYVPEWAWTTSGGTAPSYLQMPAVDFHVACATCDLNDTITGTTDICIGATSPLNVNYTGGAWSSGNTLVATVTSGGVVKGISAGIATITYSLSGHKTTSTVYIVAMPTPSAIIGVSPLCVGGSSPYLDVTPGGLWSSSSPGVAPISGGGTVFPSAAGTTTIAYTITNACGSGSATKILTVEATPSPLPIAGPTAVCVGGTITLSDVLTGGTWSITGDATISGTGVVTGVATGSASVSYVVANTCGVGAVGRSIVVVDVPDAGAISGTNLLCVADQVTLTETVSGGTWSGTTGHLLVVGSRVGGLSPGVDTVKYTTTNTCGTNTAWYVVTVADCANGVHDVRYVENVTIHPNPAQDKIFISASTIINKVEISNVVGQTVLSQAFSDRNVSMNLAQLPAGTYMVKINDANVYKVIKQ